MTLRLYYCRSKLVSIVSSSFLPAVRTNWGRYNLPALPTTSSSSSSASSGGSSGSAAAISGTGGSRAASASVIRRRRSANAAGISRNATSTPLDFSNATNDAADGTSSPSSSDLLLFRTGDGHEAGGGGGAAADIVSPMNVRLPRISVPGAANIGLESDDTVLGSAGSGLQLTARRRGDVTASAYAAASADGSRRRISPLVPSGASASASAAATEGQPSAAVDASSASKVSSAALARGHGRSMEAALHVEREFDIEVS